ncbi:hypothetical protein [Nostoc sp.]
MVIGQELLLQVAKIDISLDITTEIAEKVLTRLLRYHILHKINGGYDFEIPLLKQWVRERAVRS